MSSDDNPRPNHETVMDVTQEQIARVYALAFMAAAAKTADPAALIEELESFVVDVLDQFRQFDEVLVSSLVSHEDKVKTLDHVLSQRATPLVLCFLKVLSLRGRLDCLRSIVRAVREIYEEQSGRVDVELRVAMPVGESLYQELSRAIEQSLGKEPVLRVEVDPSLIAGFMMRVGDTIFDGSVKTRFEMARRSMIQRAIETIETNPAKFWDSAG